MKIVAQKLRTNLVMWVGLFLTLLAGVSAQAAAPVARMSAVPMSGIVPLSVEFQGNTSSCDLSCGYEWDFGDGTRSTQSFSVAHIYTSVGSFTARLTVTDGNGLRASTTLIVTVEQGETFASYVSTCKQALDFDDADIPTNLNCTKGVLFAPPNPPENDFVAYAKVTDDVDLVFACRWLENSTSGDDRFIPPFVTAASVEMIINNRKNGNTCFFKAKEQRVQLPGGGSREGVVPVAVVSPTVAAAAAPGTPEANFWEPPIELDRKLPCVDCHVAGPYIATPRIAPFLAQFGLLNNGHDTFGLTRDAQNNIVGNYRHVGTTFDHFKDLASDGNVATDLTCASGCHSIGYNGRQGDVFRGVNTLLPAINSVIDVQGSGRPEISIATAGVMPANDPDIGTAESNSYSWINRDNPGSEGVDIETFTASKNSFPVLTYCAAPTALEAHAVGSSANFSTTALATLPDKLRTFNTREGLVCDKADQPGGRQCSEYSVRYLCSDGTWTQPYNTDSASGQQDNEERGRHANVCTSPGGLTAIAIEATTTVNSSPLVVIGPNDRLAQFTPAGLICKNSDQVNGGQCSNYVTRYRGCRSSSEFNLARIKSAWVNQPTFGERYLTTTNTANNSETRAQGNNYQWPSQDWQVEYITSNTVRLKDLWSGKYLTASNNNDLATVVVQDLNTSLQRQQWEITAVTGSNIEKRLKNVGSNRYLTVGNYNGDPYYAPMLSQSYSNQNWASQRWVIQ